MNSATSPLKILICGHRSFAAKGLSELLSERGHAVTNFTRGALGVDGNTVRGPVTEMHANPHLTGPYDVVINYILLKDDTIADNEAYLASLLKFCREKGVKHLAHISSVSVYAGTERDITEKSPVESDPNQKGSYGSLKVASDQYLLNNMTDAVRVSFIRPGFVTSPGLIDPMVGMASRILKNKLLVLGASNNSLPVIRREKLNEAVVQVAEKGPWPQGEVFLMLDTNAPSRKQWLKGCCEELGVGTGVIAIPTFMWRTLGFGAGLVAKILGMKMKPGKIIRNACRVQWCNSKETERKLGVDFTVDWRKALRESMDGQVRNFGIPYPEINFSPSNAKRVTFLGYGAIVKQKHLPALKWNKFQGQIDAYDLSAATDPNGQQIQPVKDANFKPTDLAIVASPGTAHIHAINQLKQIDAPVLIEKPLCYNNADLDSFTQFAAGRPKGVYVCHNYRFKKNVAEMVSYLRRFNPGQLLHVDLLFQSLPVSNHFPAWRRNERVAQTLLMEYSLHYLDVACMFWGGDWNITQLRHTLNFLGQTNLIEGRLQCDAYSVGFVLRQGFMPRRAKVLFTFQNYVVSLGFFPDTFAAFMAHDNPWLHSIEKKSSFWATASKVRDKLLNKDSDQSHPAVFLAAMDKNSGLADAISVDRLRGFYKMLFEMSDRVYKN